jgi:hypothetical protein
MARDNSSTDADAPLAVTVSQACELSGLGPTSIWSFLRDGRLEVVRVAGLRRTLITYRSLRKLLEPQSASPTSLRRRGRRPNNASAKTRPL